MNPQSNRLTTWPLLASLCAILALLALPTPDRREVLDARPVEARAQQTSDAGRSSDARFDAPVARIAARASESSSLWRRIMLERFLEERAASYEPLFFAFPSISDVRGSVGAAPGEPFEAQPVEAAAPAVRIVGPGNVAGVWEGATVPLASRDAPSRWLTPSVGRVRAELADGTAFEGQLHSLGEGKVWIENELGRMGLLGSQIATLRQLPPLHSASSTEELPALPLVRVRTPGGVFQGRLLRREEGRVTLLTAEGGQVTLDDAELEAVRPETLVRRP